jgi:hypothetical protein
MGANIKRQALRREDHDLCRKARYPRARKVGGTKPRALILVMAARPMIEPKAMSIRLEAGPFIKRRISKREREQRGTTRLSLDTELVMKMNMGLKALMAAAPIARLWREGKSSKEMR